MRSCKKERQEKLVKLLEDNPFLTDDELAQKLTVSVPTVRLDRLELNIAEHRIRIKLMAEGAHSKLKSLDKGELVGELVYINPSVEAISIMTTDEDMLFLHGKIVRGHYIYSMAETIAIAVIDADAALIGIANIKYKHPVFAGVRLTARAEVKKVSGNKTIVWVKITQEHKEVFAGKFVLATINKGGI